MEESEKKEIVEEKKSEEIIEKRKGKVLSWLKDPLNLSLVAVLIFALAIRLYYFFLTYNQPLWWDELCYGSIAKNMISHVWDGTDLIVRESMIRPLLLPFFWSLLLRIGFGEGAARFLLEFLPSIISVFFVYLIGKEIYNKRVGIIAAFIYSTLWIQLFYTFRMMTNVPDLMFLFSSIYFFILAVKGEFKPKYFALSLFLLCFATLLRYPDGMVFFIYLFMLFLEKKFLIKKKSFWISGIVGLIPLLIFFTINYFSYGNIFPALLGGDYLRASENASGIYEPFAFGLLNFIPMFLQTPFFIFFIIGLALVLFEIILGYNLILKSERSKRNILLLLILIVFYAFFIFYLRSGEDRYLLPVTITLVCLAAFGIDYVYLFIKKYQKILAVIFVLAVLIFGAYYQFKVADPLIKDRKESFAFMKSGFEWFNSNSQSDEIIAGRAIEPYAVYYSERKFQTLPENVSGMSNITADYIALHAVNSFKPEFMQQYLTENQDKWAPINALFADQQQTQALFVVYKRI